jgi:hypothetical protein
MTEPLSNQAQKRRRRFGKRSCFCVVLEALLLLGSAAALLACFQKPFDSNDAPSHVFYVSRDGILFDLSPFEVPVVRTAVVNSFDSDWTVTRLDNPLFKNVINESGSYVVEIKMDSEAVEEKNSEESFLSTLSPPPPPTPQIYITTCSLETRNVDTQEVIASEPVFRTEEVDRYTSLLNVLSENKILFKSTRRFKYNSYQCFLAVKTNDQWSRIPIDFELGEDVEVTGWEIVKEKDSILFLLYSEEEQKAYVSSYNYQTLSVEKTIELPSCYYSGNSCYRFKYVKLRVLSGAQYFSVYQTFDESEKTDSINLAIFTTTDLTKVKEITIPRVPKSLIVDVAVVSPDLNYVAYGIDPFYLFDVKLGKSVPLRSSRPAYYRRLITDWRLFDPYEAVVFVGSASIWFIGVSKDSQTLLASDLLGDVFEWDVPTKKGKRKIANMEY